MYCLHTLPENYTRKYKKKCQKANRDSWRNWGYDPEEFPSRDDAKYRHIGSHVVWHPPSDVVKEYGIYGFLILARLDSIVLPWSFLPDNMHLF
jgi:hypothetical protein